MNSFINIIEDFVIFNVAKYRVKNCQVMLGYVGE